MEIKRAKKTGEILKTKVRALALLDIKTYYKVSVIKTVGDKQKRSPETDSSEHLIYYQDYSIDNFQ